MTLNKLLSKFLPDFNIRLRDARAQNPEWTAEHEAKWIANVFPEALQNFADMICEKQRENCADAYVEKYEDQFNGFIFEAIFSAQQPKIDEI